MSAKYGRTDKEMKNLNAAFDELERQQNAAKKLQDYYNDKRHELRQTGHKEASQTSRLRVG